MTDFGLALSSEEHPPNDLVQLARRAEETGFEFAMISDHFHPWTDAQGQSPFVWSVVGGISQATERIRLGTGVTCPTIRTHPAIIAHASATVASMMDGRFFLGLGTGENLNEHVVGEGWPAPDERLDMLEEAIEVIRTLWEGGYQTFRGEFYEVEQARLYTLPDEPPPIAVAAGKPLAAELAGRAGDALIAVAPDTEVVGNYREAGGDGPRYAQVTVCWASDEGEARETAYRWWPNVALQGDLAQELALPMHFEQACSNVSPDDVARAIVLGPDPEPYADLVREYVHAGFDHVYFHQVGPDQEGFFGFWEAQLSDRVRAL
jgi:coenzyme F420-dependent glucose-6-phosphate dehydrogenase